MKFTVPVTSIGKLVWTVPPTPTPSVLFATSVTTDDSTFVSADTSRLTSPDCAGSSVSRTCTPSEAFTRVNGGTVRVSVPGWPFPTRMEPQAKQKTPRSGRANNVNLEIIRFSLPQPVSKEEQLARADLHEMPLGLAPKSAASLHQ